ncbi:MAG: PAS-domain containing protein [Paracoccus sp. (in: a-proteobacteria)]
MMISAALIGGILSVLLASFVIRWAERPPRPALLDTNLIAPCILLFRDGKLVDATAPARNIMAACPNSDLDSLKGWLSHRFDDLSVLDTLPRNGGRAELTGTCVAADHAPLRLLAEETDDGAIRVTLTLPDSEAAGIVVDSLSQHAMEKELHLLRDIVEGAPMMITRHDNENRIAWANTAYLNTIEEGRNTPISWPLPEVLLSDATPGPDGSTCRARIEHDGITHWFDCYEHHNQDGITTYALPADAEVQAEQSLREFLQTLTKTFADLPTGLAIFDRERQLQLFNPALVDLTGLSAGFLTSQPSLYSVLDQLRELRMVPEPRDYRSWRKQITTLEAAAAAGHHVETWSLPGGRTYRVTGQPHPGGAIAFLFEDITSEITLTRKFRAELALGSQILDGLDQALIVFNAIGQVVMTNRGYDQIWGTPSGRMPDVLQSWQGEWGEAPGLRELERELGREDSPGQGQGVIFGPSNIGILNWTVSALPGGKRMVRFMAPNAAGQHISAGYRTGAATTAAIAVPADNGRDSATLAG